LQGDDPAFAYDNIFRIQANGGLINGDRPNNVNGLWFNTGRQYGGYSIDNNSQFRVNTSFSADVKNHALQIGFEYEQRSESRYSIGPIGLWGLMYQLANKAVTDIDLTKPTVITGATFDTVNFERGYNPNEETRTSLPKRMPTEILPDQLDLSILYTWPDIFKINSTLKI
jgi:hypothetical protein